MQLKRDRHMDRETDKVTLRDKEQKAETWRERQTK